MKYLGNKQRIVKDILPIMLQYNENNIFVDLFCGSCSVVQNVPSFYKRVANDKNKYLIEMFKGLVSMDTDRNISPLSFPIYISKQLYSENREFYNNEKKGNLQLQDIDYAKIGWIGWMASFNGRFFSGGYSGHNVIQKNGKSRDYITEQINNTLKQLPYLKGVEFHSGEYYNLKIPHNSIVYCDIPYKGTKQYETSKDFDYEKFYQWCRDNKDNYKIFISEYDMPSDFKCIWQKEVTNSMNPTKTYKPIEKLFTI